MNKKSQNITDQTKLYLEYADTINSLIQYFEKDSNMVYEKFKGILYNCFSEDDYHVNTKNERTFDTIEKKSWKLKGLFIHYEFWISSKDILTKDKFGFMLEIEGKQRNEFLELLDNEYEYLKDEYMKRNIEYRPTKRQIAIAYKELDNYFKVVYDGDNNLVDDIESFKFLEEKIEKVISKLKERINKV